MPPIMGRLWGSAYGIALEELTSLLERLVVVNNHPELLGGYQAEHEAIMAKLTEGYQAGEG
jgi:hypothetical protein